MMRHDRQTKQWRWSFLGAAFLLALWGFSAPAMAQAEDEAAVDADAPAADSEKKDVEEIVVTGTLVRRKDLTTPAPVAVISKFEIESSGKVSIGDILQNLPAQSGAVDLSVNNGGNGGTYISLRGIGAHRTLVLLNGRRMVYGGTGADSAVDINSIPASAIERIEVLKDGASAIYGSDAIGGVVNIITKQDYSGVEANVYAGTSQRGDATTYEMSVTAGHATKKGAILFSAGLYENKTAWAGDRDWSKYDLQIDNWNRYDVAQDPEGYSYCELVDGGLCRYKGGSSAVPQGAIIDRGEDPGGNQAWIDLNNDPDATGFWYNDPEQGWRPFNTNGVPDDPVVENRGDYYNYQPENYLMTPQKRYSLFTTGNYQLHDYVRGFFEASYVNRHSAQKLAAEPVFTISEGLVVSADNYYNPFGRDFIDVRRRMVEAGNRTFTQDLHTFRVVLGLDGSLPDGLGPLSSWTWELAYMYGANSGTETNDGNFIRNRFQDALGPSFRDPATGDILCGAPGAVIDGCVPLNLFGGPGTITDEMLGYLGYTGTRKGFNDLESVRFFITGDVYEIPFGDMIGVAFGYEYREEFGGTLPNPLEAKGETTGNKSEPVEGGFFINEVFAELNIPLLARMPAVELLELTGALRFSAYNRFDSALSWKAGLRWQIIPDLTVRGTYSTAFRAPTVYQMFSGRTESFPFLLDMCSTDNPTYLTNQTVRDRCAEQGAPAGYINPDDQQKSYWGGNINLEPETAVITTAGLVFQPGFLKGFSATADFYLINIDNSIQRTGEDVIMNQCYTGSGNYQFYCDKIHRRPGSFTIAYIDDQNTNIGGLDTWGVDIAANYDWKSPIGRLLFSFDGTYVGQFDQILSDQSVVSGLGTYDLEVVMPSFKFNFGIIWGWEGLGAGVQGRFVGGIKECENNDCKDQLAWVGATAPTPADDPTLDPSLSLRQEPGEDGQMGTDDDEWMRKAYSRDVSPVFTLDLFISYSLEWSAGITKFTFGITNLLDTPPAVIYNGFNNTTDPAEYDVLGRYFYFRLAQAF
jgi:outer membrane receptor protein involved in Fe transport